MVTKQLIRFGRTCCGRVGAGGVQVGRLGADFDAQIEQVSGVGRRVLGGGRDQRDHGDQARLEDAVCLQRCRRHDAEQHQHRHAHCRVVQKHLRTARGGG